MEDSQHLSTTESETSLYISTSLDENALPAIIRSLLSLLPAEFESKLLIEEAKAQGIPQSTVMRWCSQWIENGLLHRPSFGHYKKIV